MLDNFAPYHYDERGSYTARRYEHKYSNVKEEIMLW